MYLLIFLLLIGVGVVASYILFIKEKRDELELIKNRVCPKCKREAVELIDQRGGGCGGAKMVTFECRGCGYSAVFNIDERGCSGGGCSI